MTLIRRYKIYYLLLLVVMFLIPGLLSRPLTLARVSSVCSDDPLVCVDRIGLGIGSIYLNAIIALALFVLTGLVGFGIIYFYDKFKAGKGKDRKK